MVRDDNRLRDGDGKEARQQRGLVRVRPSWVWPAMPLKVIVRPVPGGPAGCGCRRRVAAREAPHGLRPVSDDVPRGTWVASQPLSCWRKNKQQGGQYKKSCPDLLILCQPLSRAAGCRSGARGSQRGAQRGTMDLRRDEVRHNACLPRSARTGRSSMRFFAVRAAGRLPALFLCVLGAHRGTAALRHRGFLPRPDHHSRCTHTVPPSQLQAELILHPLCWAADSGSSHCM